MAKNCSSIEAWAYRPAFSETTSWIADAYVRENEALTKALQISLSDDSSASETLSSCAYFPPPAVAVEQGPAGTRCGGNGSNPNSNPIPCSLSGKITKRKSRASKRSPTTYINADPTNFRRLVQEVTGIRFGETDLPVESVVRPEAQRAGMSRAVQSQGYLPTLESSALLLDHACGTFGPMIDGPVYDLEPFPTLESWGM
ncbi:hypothetical protein HPP92_012446 [Vanilla planifolia]|uniref:VQ domain-containing protein n=1 Tax=Vanilla planifolia TaxID=51239 RepID=A0A835R0Z0_VANPL|nr:hypothetical protein HPP92_012446 [Vanilla planifolia]